MAEMTSDKDQGHVICPCNKQNNINPEILDIWIQDDIQTSPGSDAE